MFVIKGHRIHSGNAYSKSTCAGNEYSIQAGRTGKGVEYCFLTLVHNVTMQVFMSYEELNGLFIGALKTGQLAYIDLTAHTDPTLKGEGLPPPSFILLKEKEEPEKKRAVFPSAALNKPR